MDTLPGETTVKIVFPSKKRVCCKSREFSPKGVSLDLRICPLGANSFLLEQTLWKRNKFYERKNFSLKGISKRIKNLPLFLIDFLEGEQILTFERRPIGSICFAFRVEPFFLEGGWSKANRKLSPL